MLLDALGYLGDSLNKPGRAVRGLLGGRPEEALAAIPFSDALGITDQANQVTGRDLLSQLGIDPGDGIGGTLAGMGMDVATDPLTYAGGGLLRKFLGSSGGAARAAAPAAEGHIFDLVSPAEREIEKLLPKAAPAVAPAAEAVQAAAPRLEAAAEPALQQAAQGMPEAITKLPPFQNYQHLVEWGPDARAAGIPGDALMEGDKDTAFRLALSGWDSVLGDLGSMSGGALKELGLAGSDVPTEAGRVWNGSIARHLADLRTVEQLGAAGAVHREVAGLASAQAERLMHYANNHPESSASFALHDILAGQVAPSRIAGQMDYIGHLPVDEAALKRLAAQGQSRVVRDDLAAAREVLDDTAGATDAPLSLLLRQLHAGEIARPEGVVPYLESFLPGRFKGMGIEPSVTRSTFDRLPDNLRFDPQELLAAIRQFQGRV